MTSTDPRDTDFDLGLWGEARQQEARRRVEEQRRRDAAWREDERTRDRFRDSLAPSYVAVPIPDAQPGEPRFVMVRQG